MTKVSFDDQFRAAALIFLADLIKRAEEVIFPLGRASPAPLLRPRCHFCQLIPAHFCPASTDSSSATDINWLPHCAPCVQGTRRAPEEGSGRERGEASGRGGGVRPKRSRCSMRARARRPHARPISRCGCSSPRARQPTKRVRIVSFSARRTRPCAGVSPDAERVRRERRSRAISNDFSHLGSSRSAMNVVVYGNSSITVTYENAFFCSTSFY